MFKSVLIEKHTVKATQTLRNAPSLMPGLVLYFLTGVPVSLMVEIEKDVVFSLDLHTSSRARARVRRGLLVEHVFSTE